MHIYSGYTIPFSYRIGFCLHDTVLLCTAMVSLYAFASTARCIELIMRLHIEVTSMPDSIVYTTLDWFHATFRAFSFKNVKEA